MLLVMITKGQKPSLSRGCTKTLSTNTIERNLLSSKKLKVPLNTNQTIKNHNSKTFTTLLSHRPCNSSYKGEVLLTFKYIQDRNI